MRYAKIRNYACRIKDDIFYKGLRTVFLENNTLRVGILADKGTDIFEFLYKPADMDFIWLYPRGFVNPSNYSMTKNQSGGRFMDFYEGGWQEIFPNGGGTCSVMGAEYGQHDEISLLPWEYEIIEDKKDRVEVLFFTDTRLSPFSLEKILRLDKDIPALNISEKITNTSSVDIGTVWGHHLVYGLPFLEEGCTIELNAKKCLTYDLQHALDGNIPLNEEFIWPILTATDSSKIDLSVIPDKSVESAKFLYINEVMTGKYEILNKKKNLGIRVEWDKEVMPYLWFWQEFNKSNDYPWYKMARVFGLEPFSTNTMGLDNTIKMQKDLVIRGNCTKEFNMTISVKEICKKTGI